MLMLALAKQAEKHLSYFPKLGIHDASASIFFQENFNCILSNQGLPVRLIPDVDSKHTSSVGVPEAKMWR